MSWLDTFKIWQSVFDEPPSIKVAAQNNIQPSGITQPDITNIRADSMNVGGSGFPMMRSVNDYIDMGSTVGRQNRLLEYEKLRTVAEIETALTIYANEACVAGDTEVATPFGFKTIEDLAKNKKDEIFLVYCYDFNKEDFTLGWAFAPRVVSEQETVKIIFDDGESQSLTPDHLCLLDNGEWIAAGDLKSGDEMMAFHRVPRNETLCRGEHENYHRIFSRKDGWKNEKQFIQEWKTGSPSKRYTLLARILKLMFQGLRSKEISEITGDKRIYLDFILKRDGFTYQEVLHLLKVHNTYKTVKDVVPAGKQLVYDLSVKDHENFATRHGVYHNCQEGENHHVCEVISDYPEIKEMSEDLLFNDLHIDEIAWSDFKNMCINGDHFYEMIMNTENPQDGILGIRTLPAHTMFRIETVQQRLLEFQQSVNGSIDYSSVMKKGCGGDKTNNGDITAGSAIRFTPDQIVHMRIGDRRKLFYPYGQSILEPCRSAAHILRLMEDAMLVYRLTRTPERRAFFIDFGEMHPSKIETSLKRLQDQFRKKKVFRSSSGNSPTGIDENWNPQSFDEDIWIPIREGSATRIDTLQGAQNIGEVSDVSYFRNKLLIALNIPKGYLSQDDATLTRVNLSNLDIMFSKMIARLQAVFAKGLQEVCQRHLQLKGVPYSKWSSLKVKMHQSSDWAEMSRSEIVEARYNRAIAIKGAGLFSDYDILVEILKLDVDKAKDIVARAKEQKLDDIKLQIISSNPEYLMPNPAGETPENEVGVESGGPTGNLDLTNSDQQPQGQAQLPEQQPAQNTNPSSLLPEPSQDDINKYDLSIVNNASEQDIEDIDLSELE